MVLALANAAYALLLPVYLLTPYPFWNVLLRLPYGYLAMKVLDLVVARSNDPPILKDQGKLPTTFRDQLRYAFLLTQQTRYESFNISTTKPVKNPPSIVQHLVIYATILLFNIFLPIPEVKVSFVLISIYTLFELGHSILRPNSISPLFNRPFLSPTLGHFWSRGWHSIILSPLNSLAFDPASKLGGRPASVFAAFTLSGIWHGWAVIPVGGYALAWKVCMVFVMQAAWIMTEYAIWGREKPFVRRVAAWGWSIAWAGWALRSWEGRHEYWL
jgi:hypothetical protein